MMRYMEAQESSASSESEDEDESVFPDPRRIKIGQEVPDLKMDCILPGNLVSVEETSSSSYFSRQTRLIQEEKNRRYNMVVLKGSGQSSGFLTGLQHVGKDGSLGTQMTVEEVERALVGRVSSIVETTTRRIFSAGELVSEEEINRKYVVDMITPNTKAQL